MQGETCTCAVSRVKTSKSELHKDFVVRPLGIHDAPELSALLRSQTAEYVRYFSPFNFDEDTLQNVLARAKEDVFQGFYLDERLIGLMMLRGWDDGYKVPALGVFVGEEHRGYGLMTLAVEITKVTCRLRGVGRVMYKAHPDNIPAKSAERLGFTRTGIDAVTDHFVYHLDFPSL